jgi:hypothetical protein
MRKLFVILASVLLTVRVFAQSPEKMSYQAVIRDADNNLVTNQAVGMQISILKGSTVGTRVYIETQNPTTNSNGLVTLEIGTGSSSNNFSSIDWGNSPYFLKVETDPTGGNSYTITGISEILSVPYALHAKTADSIVGVTIKKYSVGDFVNGGILYWVDETGQHGLVCAKEDQSTGIRWYSGTYGFTRALGTGPLAGKMNTSIIIASQVAIGDASAKYAARVCIQSEITEKGITYGDWYLPSKGELNLMYENKTIIDSTALANSGSVFTTTGHYWSSTEYSDQAAWSQYFKTGYQDMDWKYSTYRVRAVRAF